MAKATMAEPATTGAKSEGAITPTGSDRDEL